MSINTLLIAPPFLRCDTACLGLHLLQAYAQKHGFSVDISYQNIKFASLIGLPLFHGIAWSEEEDMLGERVFCQAAYDLPLLGYNAVQDLANFSHQTLLENGEYVSLNYDVLAEVAQQVPLYIENLLDEIADKNYQVVGCTTMFQLNASAVAILRAVKERFPHITTIIGGANCAGEMAKGVATLSDQIDYIFSGESEQVFVQFLEDLALGQKPAQRIIQGVKVKDLDEIPAPDFSDFYGQIKVSGLPIQTQNNYIPYEASRGCWWGEVYRCKFCSIHDLAYRKKSPEKIIEDLKEIMRSHISNKVFFTDDIMPNEFFDTLYPYLQEEIPGIRFYSTQKSNIKLDKMQSLAQGGGNSFLPGTEALSTELLKLVDKGTTARQNIAMLRYARATLTYAMWNMLYGIPGEKAAYYQSYLTLIPLIHHLNPPRFYQRVEIQKFGVYMTHPEENQVTNIRPWDIYAKVLPTRANIPAVAYHFDADYPSILREAPELVIQIEALVKDWRAKWSVRGNMPPMLQVDAIAPGIYQLTDTRDVSPAPGQKIVTEQQANTALVAKPMSKLTQDWDIDWGLEHKVGIILDHWWVPLATAPPELLKMFETQQKTSPRPQQQAKIQK